MKTVAHEELAELKVAAHVEVAELKKPRSHSCILPL
jgi:hypothetical protein